MIKDVRIIVETPEKCWVRYLNNNEEMVQFRPSIDSGFALYQALIKKVEFI